MSKNLQTPTKLTEFAPLQQEEKPQSVGQFISKFFKIAKSEEDSNSESNSSAQENVPTWAKDTMEPPESAVPNIYPVDINEGRSLPNVLKRISNLLALKTNSLQDYSNTELKQYWMPDSVSKECYECSEKFTTFRRRHHCRVCGQIFCSQCCNQQIPGKIFGCTGDLRVCTYCCKIVLSYLQSSSFGVMNLSSDLKVLQESLQSKFGDSPNTLSSNDMLQSSNLNTTETSEPLRRKISVGYQEEKFASGGTVSYLTNEEKCRALQNSMSLRNLFEEICKPVTGITFVPFKYRLRIFQDCFLGSELVDWLICQQKAKTRVQAAALSQALLEGGYIESLSETNGFVDGYVRYRKGNLFSPNPLQISPTFDVPVQEEPSWVQQIPQESSNTDSDNEQMSPSLTGLSTSSSYMLNLNVEASTVYLSRPPDSSYDLQGQEKESTPQCEREETAVVRPSEQRELAPESGWFNASVLREENCEREAYELLSETYEQHIQTLAKQLLSFNSLPHSWEKDLVPLINNIVSVVRPDKNHDAVELDIRNYVQFKKLPGGDKKDTCLVDGIICSKNVAHKEMSTDINNPKILLLQCSIVYQRTEGRLMSLEPVLMQEHEYLRHVAARIVSLRPDIVLVHKNVSRLAQDMLRQHNITLVHNVKQTVLERVSRCTQADIVTAVDAHIGRPKLGTCKRFYLKRFNIDKGLQKTLMFFEGLPCPWLGATFLLRGPSKLELSKLKKIASFLLFTGYNWRLEKSFLMDEFALPPNSKIEFLDDSRENSPQFPKPKVSIDEHIDEETQRNNAHETKKDANSEKKQTASQKTTLSSISDFTDPLQSSFDANKNTFESNSGEILSVAQLPFSNDFKKHLDDTILCISPYIMFPIPYLETDLGKKGKLRRFFYKDLYYSAQFDGNTKNKRKNLELEKNTEAENNKNHMMPLHPFQTVQITSIENNNIQNLLANFRACGGQYRKKETLNIVEATTEINLKEYPDNSKKDVLDPENHQRLAVLFCSFSHESHNAPAFCVNPWVVYMDFYGRNDIPIGCFLERYCFRTTYICPSKSCNTPMVKHIRRFVHNSGCVTISLNNFDSEFSEESIVMWSWCTQCQSVSPVVPMSADTWSYSFGKYLELRFHGEIFNRRGQNPCKHSLHHDHFQYFGYKNYVASFKYSSINIWEISLPPSLVELSYNMNCLHQALIEETRKNAQKGHDIFTFIQDKLASVNTEELEGTGNIKQLFSKEQAQFKHKVEEVQLKLTSPSVESKEFDGKNLYQSLWKIQDYVTKLKMYLVETTESWNMYLTEAIRQDKKKEKSSLPELESPVSENNESKTLLNPPKDNGEFERELIPDDFTQRRYSDVSVITQVEESTDSKKELAKKSEKSVKTILDKLLPSSGTLTLVPVPFPPQEHYLLAAGQYGPQVVYENEISSIISYALNTLEYKRALEELTAKKLLGSDQSPSPVPKRRSTTSEKEKADGEDKGSGLLGFLRNKDTKTELLSSVGASSVASEATEPDQAIPQEKPEDAKKTKNSHIEVQFQDTTCNFFCRVYLADKFANLRAAVLPVGEEAYIRSLSRSVEWKARGGKSGSNFSKTLDDRFILKDMSKTEVQLFLESATNYFVYMQKCHTTAQPTLLGKILGIYQIIYKNNSNVTHRSNVLVMENLFYNRDVSQKFDLKGSMRNRLVVPDNQEGEIVLLDENLLKMTCDSPLYVLPHSKEVLLAAIQNDTDFLSTQSVMDYSLLVGLDTRNKELVLGIIDYIRTFTWDKRLETMVKRMGGQGKLPTIVSPEVYQKRFIEAMHKYFLEVPDHYAGLCKGLEV